MEILFSNTFSAIFHRMNVLENEGFNAHDARIKAEDEAEDALDILCEYASASDCKDILMFMVVSTKRATYYRFKIFESLEDVFEYAKSRNIEFCISNGDMHSTFVEGDATVFGHYRILLPDADRDALAKAIMNPNKSDRTFDIIKKSSVSVIPVLKDANIIKEDKNGYHLRDSNDSDPHGECFRTSYGT